MNISVFGLGYVGSVSATCLARDGHRVIGVDTHVGKVELINRGASPIVEPGLPELIRRCVQSGRLRATVDAAEAVANSDVSIVCVGTPSRRDGALDTKFLRNACQEIGKPLRSKEEFHIVLIRSTMLPGTMRQLVIPELEKTTGRQAGVGFGICINPEFLRESTALFDYDNPPKIVIGANDPTTAEVVGSLFEHLPAPLIKTRIEVAEAVKYTDNAWHAVKVDFANEIGTLCSSVGVDGNEVMDIFLQDTKLNISPYYMRPGPAFGGSCLPKDVRALTYLARTKGIRLPLLENVLASNDEQLRRALELIEDQGNRNIGILGISFKAKTDDLRESPMLRIAEQLHGRGYSLRIFDPSVSDSVLTGANKEYMTQHLSHIYEMLTDSRGVLEHARTLVVGNKDDRYRSILEDVGPQHRVIDLAGLGTPSVTTLAAVAGDYEFARSQDIHG
jgi:GDP-mannose 6-dehydrogenase